MERIEAEKAVKLIAMREGVSVDAVREQMKRAMLSGMSSPDPVIQAKWKKIPSEGEIPTPEELIAYITACIDGGSEPFA